MSNNTIVADTYDYLSPLFWEGYKGNGEPLGLFNKKLSQTYGRIGDVIKDNCLVPNPCAEQILEPYESCNLSEIFLNNITSLEELQEVSYLLYKAQKAVTQMNYIFPESKEIINKNARIGIGITGITQSLDKLEWLDATYSYLREKDKEWSTKKGWPESIKITTTKPSGTLSLLAGSSPGVHPAYAEYYIRRVRIVSEHSLTQAAKENNYPVEYVRNFDGTEDYTTKIISFPVHVKNAIYAKDMSAVRQLNLVKTIQKVWSDSSVSVTVYYRKEELEDIQQWLKENYEDNIKSVSFLLHQDHGFDQAPYEEITKEEYEDLNSSIIPLLYMNDQLDIDDQDCSTGACPIR